MALVPALGDRDRVLAYSYATVRPYLNKSSVKVCHMVVEVGTVLEV